MEIYGVNKTFLTSLGFFSGFYFCFDHQPIGEIKLNVCRFLGTKKS